MDSAKPAKAGYHTNLGLLLVIISAAGFGFLGIFAKYAFAAGVNVITLSTLRFSVAAIAMWLVLLIKRENPLVTGKQLLALICLGVLGYAVMSSLYFSAVELIPASLVAILMYTYPVLVTVLSSWINREPVTGRKILSLLISFTGLLLVVGVVFRGLNGLGVFFASINALVYSFFIVLSNKLVGKISPLVVTTYIISAAAAALACVGFFTRSLALAVSSGGWLAVSGVAFFSTVTAILTFFQGMKIIGPSRASIISTLEPVVATLAAFLLFAEKMTWVQVLGGLMVIGAVILVQKEE